MIEIFIRILGTLLFFLPGFLMSFILFPSSTVLKRSIFTIALSSSLSTILAMFLVAIGKLKVFPIIFSLIFFSLFLLLLLFLKIKIKKERIKTIFNKKPFFLVLFFSLIGTLWRTFLKNFFSLSGDAYFYASYLIEKSIKKTGSLLIEIPDLNFYTGMVGGHAHYLGGILVKIIWESVAWSFYFLNTFLAVFLFLGFSYLTILFLTKRKDLVFLGTFLMALGPVEIWKTTQLFFGHPLSYIALFALFLFFFRPTFGYFFLALFLSIATIFSYYTGAMVVMITSLGFLIANLIFKILKRRSLKEISFILFNKKNILFAFIILFSSLFVFLVSNANKYTQANIRYLFSQAKKTITPLTLPADRIKSPNRIKSPMSLPIGNFHYSGPFKIGTIPLLALEDLIFGLLPLSFLFSFFSQKKKKREILFALCFIPVSLLSLGFLFVNLPERIFYYFAFFTIASIRTSQRTLFKIGIFLLLLTIIFTFLRFYKRPYLTKFQSEIEAAKWIRENIKGIVFTDQHLANILILNDFYQVQGIGDSDERNLILYREKDPIKIVKSLRSLGADYIALTKRMREIYILSLNFPQLPMSNSQVYEENFQKVYDNNDVRVYKIPSLEIK
ncbi:MAG: hypothetical protein ACPLZH_01130 [Minisyncoccales bacterium]